MKKKLLAIALPFLTITGLKAQSVNLSQGLVAHYDFTNSVTDDLSGNFLHLINNNCTAATDRFSVAGNAFDFNGFSSYMNAAHDPLLNPGPTMSISIWVNPASANLNQKLIGKTNVNFDGGYLIGIQNGQAELEVWDAATNHWTLNGGTINAGAWNHIVMTYLTVDSMKLYVNGQLVNKTFVGDYVGDNVEDLIVGSAPWDPANYFHTDGGIDDIRIYNRPINVNEVLALYNQTVTGVAQSGISKSINIKPLPAEGLWSLSGAKAGSTVVIYSADGKAVMNISLNDENGELINLQALPAGMYLMELKSDNQSYTSKLVR